MSQRFRLRFGLFVVFAVLGLLAAHTVVLTVQASAVASDIADQQTCPKVTVTSPDSVNDGDALTFTAQVTGGPKDVSPTYNWAVSSGSISSGQGTSNITVDTKGVGGGTITATVDLGGYDRSCSTSASSTAIVNQKVESKKIDEYGAVALPKERETLQKYAIELMQNPTAQGYVFAYAGPSTTASQVAVATKRAKEYMVKELGVDGARLVVVDGGKRKEFIVELWLVPTGAAPPKPTPKQ